MAQVMTIKTLKRDHDRFAGTKGISDNNTCSGFVPAFIDSATGITYISRNPDGTVAACHRIDGLPDEVVTQKASDGSIIAVADTIVPGFVKDDQFYTREEAIAALS